MKLNVSILLKTTTEQDEKITKAYSYFLSNGEHITRSEFMRRMLMVACEHILSNHQNDPL